MNSVNPTALATATAGYRFDSPNVRFFSVNTLEATADEKEEKEFGTYESKASEFTIRFPEMIQTGDILELNLDSLISNWQLSAYVFREQYVLPFQITMMAVALLRGDANLTHTASGLEYVSAIKTHKTDEYEPIFIVLDNAENPDGSGNEFKLFEIRGNILFPKGYEILSQISVWTYIQRGIQKAIKSNFQKPSDLLISLGMGRCSFVADDDTTKWADINPNFIDNYNYCQLVGLDSGNIGMLTSGFICPYTLSETKDSDETPKIRQADGLYYMIGFDFSNDDIDYVFKCFQDGLHTFWPLSSKMITLSRLLGVPHDIMVPQEFQQMLNNFNSSSGSAIPPAGGVFKTSCVDVLQYRQCFEGYNAQQCAHKPDSVKTFKWGTNVTVLKVWLNGSRSYASARNLFSQFIQTFLFTIHLDLYSVPDERDEALEPLIRIFQASTEPWKVVHYPTSSFAREYIWNNGANFCLRYLLPGFHNSQQIQYVNAGQFTLIPYVPDYVLDNKRLRLTIDPKEVDINSFTVINRHVINAQETLDLAIIESMPPIVDGTIRSWNTFVNPTSCVLYIKPAFKLEYYLPNTCVLDHAPSTFQPLIYSAQNNAVNIQLTFLANNDFDRFGVLLLNENDEAPPITSLAREVAGQTLYLHYSLVQSSNTLFADNNLVKYTSGYRRVRTALNLRLPKIRKRKRR